MVLNEEFHLIFFKSNLEFIFDHITSHKVPNGVGTIEIS